MTKSDATLQEVRENEALKTPTDLSRKGVGEISGALRQLLADMFALYVKTKNFHWHMSGAHFRDYHLLLDEESAQILATTDPIAECGRPVGQDATSSRRGRDGHEITVMIRWPATASSGSPALEPFNSECNGPIEPLSNSQIDASPSLGRPATRRAGRRRRKMAA